MLPLAISMGDPSGIGPDVLLKTWAHRQNFQLPPMVVIGDHASLSHRADLLGITADIAEFNPEIPKLSCDSLNVLNVSGSVVGTPGRPDTADAKATIEAIETAVSMCMTGAAAGMVTGPINKSVLYGAGFSHPGHTEFLADLAHRHTGKATLPVMMIAGPELRTIPVTIHIPLNEVSSSLTAELIMETALVADHDLRNRFGFSSPRLAIAGLNPHAGESGSLGVEEIDVVTPAAEALRAKGINVKGPLPADTMFHPSARRAYDVAICMYHDQALIPAKMLGFDDAVNVTLGLPFIRTSPDHGTAYDIAGTGKANPSSFIAALKMAQDMAGRN